MKLKLNEEVLKKISEDYFQNQITMDNIVSRNVITTDDYPRALYELNLKDKILPTLLYSLE